MTDLLRMSVEAGVLLRIAELEQRPYEDVFVELDAHRDEWVDLIGSKGDVLLYGGGKPGEAAAAHTALVNAIAFCAFAPGGVTFLDTHYEAKGGT